MLLAVAAAAFDKLSLAMVVVNGRFVVYAYEDVARIPEAGVNTKPFPARNNYCFKGGDRIIAWPARLYGGRVAYFATSAVDWGAGTIAHLCVFTARQQSAPLSGCTVLSFACPTNNRAARASLYIPPSDHSCYDVQAPQSSEPGGARPSRTHPVQTVRCATNNTHFDYPCFKTHAHNHHQSHLRQPATLCTGETFLDSASFATPSPQTTFTSIPPAQPRRLFLTSSLEQPLWHGYLPICTYGRRG